jgi:hypothetical protein
MDHREKGPVTTGSATSVLSLKFVYKSERPSQEFDQRFVPEERSRILVVTVDEGCDCLLHLLVARNAGLTRHESARPNWLMDFGVNLRRLSRFLPAIPVNNSFAVSVPADGFSMAGKRPSVRSRPSPPENPIKVKRLDVLPEALESHLVPILRFFRSEPFWFSRATSMWSCSYLSLPEGAGPGFPCGNRDSKAPKSHFIRRFSHFGGVLNAQHFEAFLSECVLYMDKMERWICS